MLYTFCGGRDVAGAAPVNYATTPNMLDAEGTDTTPGKRAKDRAGTVYHESQLREMAQYAVNLVDAMDRDDVITRFEYDLDLSNGWGLDDDPYTTFDGGAERSEVYGREAATLAFNEAHVFESPYMTMDNKGTEFDDTDPDDTDSETGRFFTYLELFNVAPRDIDFINQEWRILLVSDDGLGADTTNLTELRFLPGTGTIEAGRLFTLGSCSDSTVTDTVGTSVGVGNSYSVFKVDPTSDGTSANFSIPGSEIIPPDGSSLSGIRTLDLIADATTGKFSITTTGNTMRVSGSSPSSVQGAFINWTNVPNPLAGVEFHLQRRVHPTRAVPAAGPGTEQDDNPWVTVDEIAPNDPAGAVPRFDIELSSTATGPVGKSLPAALLKLTSQQRELVLRSSLVPETQSGVNKLNSIGIDNNNTPLPDSNSLWQPIFNREFTSLGRLLTVSLAGEGPVTEIYNSPAAIRFLVPAGHHVGLDGAPGVAGTDDDGKNGVDDIGELGLGDDVTPLDQSLANRWYRLFGFLQIPPRLHRGTRPELSNPLNVVRTHGQLNPNTFRHPEVFAGWIDDRHTLNLDGLDISANPLYGDRPAFAAGLIRNWWQEFVKSRDGIDGLPSNPATGAAEDQDPVSQMYLPGMPGSRPFRSATQTVGGNGSTSATMLRTRALNLTSGSLGLFDAWDPAPAAQQTLDWDIAGASGVAADPHVRTRILSKILNNTTNRSNVFMVHVTVGFFEAVEVGVDLDDDTVIDLNAYRIGGEWSGRPRQNGFFIVDRSLAEEAYEEASGSFSKWEETVKFASHPLDE